MEYRVREHRITFCISAQVNVNEAFYNEDYLMSIFLAGPCYSIIRAGIEVACFNNHSRPVEHFLQVPEDGNSRMRRSVISVAEDHSVAIISIEEMSW